MPVPQGSTQTDAQAWAKIKPYASKAIKDAIASAVLSGITVTLPSNVAYLDVEQSFTARQVVSKYVTNTSGDLFSLLTLTSVDPSGASSTNNVGFQSFIYSTAGNSQTTSGRMVAVQGITAHYGDSTLGGTNRGILASWVLRSGATVGAATCLSAELGIDASSGGTLTTGRGILVRTSVTVASTITNGQGIYIENPIVSGGGAITSFAGIIVDAITTPTNYTNVLLGTTTIPSGTYNIYAASALDNYLAGKVTINKAVGSELLRLESTATNDDPRVSWYQNRVATTDATVTAISTIAVPASTTVTIIAIVTARRTGGVAGTAEDGASYGKAATYKNVAGTATQIGTTSNIFAVKEDQAGWDADFAVSGGNVLINVTGATNNNVTWHVTYEYYSVGS